ncbi:MAG: hypothetical protein ACWGN1_00195, partial [Desulfobulbales bacterium]
MKIFKSGIFLLLVSCLAWSLPATVYSQTTAQSEEPLFAVLTPTAEQKIINDDIVEQLKYRHYLKVDFDDHLSSKILTRYLDELDP